MFEGKITKLCLVLGKWILYTPEYIKIGAISEWLIKLREWLIIMVCHQFYTCKFYIELSPTLFLLLASLFRIKMICIHRRSLLFYWKWDKDLAKDNKAKFKKGINPHKSKILYWQFRYPSLVIADYLVAYTIYLVIGELGLSLDDLIKQLEICLLVWYKWQKVEGKKSKTYKARFLLLVCVAR